jgi:uncharacterized protein (TIGR00369 family)
MPTSLTLAEIEDLFAREFPQVRETLPGFTIERIEERGCRVRLAYMDRHLRPGGTISGPALFALADLALYVALLATIGPQTLAVTTNMSLNFLRKPAARDVIAECRLMKVGKTLAVGEITMRSDGEDEPCAHAVGTYAIPPAR